jgi:hypothetical protein
MEPISIEGTPKTPTVRFDPVQGLLEIKGRSSPENSFEFYKPLVNCLLEYAKNPGDKTIVNIQLDYFNTGSSKCILEVFKKLEAIYKANHEVLINWYFENDESILEAGEDYKLMTGIPFKMIQIAE